MNINYNKIKLYYKTLLFKIGLNVSMNVTYNCNFKCWYCAVTIPTGAMPKSKESTAEQWLDFRFPNYYLWFNIKIPLKIRQVAITGGEPTLYSDLVKLVNALLDKGYHVTVYSNLTRPKMLMEIQKNYRFQIVATYHHHDNADRFDQAYRMVYSKHRINVEEIDDKHGVKKLSYSKLKPLITGKEKMPVDEFRISPNREISIGCVELFSKTE
jgi:wyosine [tRNA(Phe)-imidazoG37] synthetase (radical SAM superfamily)